MNDERADEIIGTYGGDAFGNGDTTMLRCRQCSGVYLKAPDPLKPYVMGMILSDDGGRGQRRRESKLNEIYAQGPACRCPKTEAGDSNWFGGLGKRPLRPPMHESEWANKYDNTGPLFEWLSPTDEPGEEEERREAGPE